MTVKLIISQCVQCIFEENTEFQLSITHVNGTDDKLVLKGK